MRSLLALAFVLVFVNPVHASDCVPSTSSPEVTLCGVDTTPCFYFDLELCDLCGIVWIYEESNGYDGMQRRDEVVDDTCNGQIAGDTIHF